MEFGSWACRGGWDRARKFAGGGGGGRPQTVAAVAAVPVAVASVAAVPSAEQALRVYRGWGLGFFSLGIGVLSYLNASMSVGWVYTAGFRACPTVTPTFV